MKIEKLTSLTKKPPLYEVGTAIMWTDPHISKELLKAHLDPNHDAASRNPKSIQQIISWMKNQINPNSKDCLDLGCGPGLYCEQLQALGYHVTGIDFSQNSIDYASIQAKQKSLSIDYIYANYLEYQFTKQYDLIYIIYCDFGVLSKDQQKALLTKVYAGLKTGGTLILDAYNLDLIKKRTFEKDFEVSLGGFWSPNPYLCLSHAFHYPSDKLTLDQHIVIDEEDNYKVYRFWEHYFDQEEMVNLLKASKFSSVITENVLEDDYHITFYAATK